MHKADQNWNKVDYNGYVNENQRLEIFHKSKAELITFLNYPNYVEALPPINILMINVATTFFFRVPLSNILTVVRKAKWCSYSAIAMLLINLLLNYLLITRVEIFGTAYATVISISECCVITMILFATYLKNLDK